MGAKSTIIHESSANSPDIFVRMHDSYHAFIRTTCEPICSLIPRKYFGVDVFTANAVTYSRGIMGIFIIGFLIKYQYLWTSFWLIIFHDFLDHIDGVVAFVQRKKGIADDDDPVFGAFIDAQCDKIVFVALLWSNLMVKELRSYIFVLLPLLLIALESAIFTLRTRNYFKKMYENNPEGEKKRPLKAVSEGKLKQKCETLGLSFFSAEWYCTGCVFFLFALKYGWTSLSHKLK